MTSVIYLLLICALRIGCAAATPYAGTVSIPVDHFNKSDTRTFSNRYWMNDTHYSPGGPIFFYDFGEIGVFDFIPELYLSGSYLRFSPLELARKYHGIVIIWEHRFYGSSVPFALNATTGLATVGYDAYKYLTNEQALEDAVFFAGNFSPRGYGEDECISMRANSTPWIWIGGSYPGTRAAMIRVRNPDVFFASWASSAPVQNVVDGSVYYNTIQQSLPRNCSADIHAAITYADHILSSGSAEDVALLERAVGLTYAANPRQNLSSPPDSTRPDSEVLTYWQVATTLSYAFQATIQGFQSSGYETAFGDFCNHIETWNPSNFSDFNLSSPPIVLSQNSLDASITTAGVAATYSSKMAFYAYLYATIQKSVSDYNFLPGNPRTAADAMSWTWQLCSQFAQFQTTQAYSHPDSNLITKFYNVSAHRDFFCHINFPYAPEMPDVASVRKYGGWRMRPSNVMWTNGEVDPWRSLGVQATRNINPEALERRSTEVVPRCGRSPQGYEVFGLVYENQVHVQDMTAQMPVGNETEMTPAALGLELFGKALDVWLPCFRPSVGLEEDGEDLET